MSLSTGYPLQIEGLKLLGYSVAGITTSLVMPEVDVCFDVGQGLPFQIPVPNILITHGHMDHASGLPYLIAMKSMMGQVIPNIYMPELLVDPMTRIMKIWAEIDHHEYKFNFIPTRDGQSVQLKGNYSFQTFPTFHRVPANGYTIFERKKRLKKKYQGATQQELGHLRRQGDEIDERIDEPILSFTGDSKIEFLENDAARNSRVLVMEVTYWDKKKSVENAREWGHIHLDELIENLDQIQARKIVLIHASARYSTRVLNETLEDRIPEHHKDRIVIFPRPS